MIPLQPFDPSLAVDLTACGVQNDEHVDSYFEAHEEDYSIAHYGRFDLI